MTPQSTPPPESRPHRAAGPTRPLATLAKVALGVGALFASEHVVDGVHDALAGHATPHDLDGPHGLEGQLAGIEYQNHVLDSVGGLQSDIDFHNQLGNVVNGLDGSLYVDY